MTESKGRDAPIRLLNRRTLAANRKWRVYLDRIADDKGLEVDDFLVLASPLPRNDLVTGVTVLPILQGDIVLLRIYRHPLARHCLEAVRGFLDPGETPEGAALRELTEETGLDCPPEALVPLGHCAPEASTMAARAALFAATQCRPGGRIEETEMGIETTQRFSRDDAVAMLRRFEIEDATTLVAMARFLAL